MAVLNKIRKQSLVLIAVIAMALFSFVLADLFKNTDALTGGSQDIVATINGTDINREGFMNRVEAIQRQLGPNATSTQAMNRVYDQEVRKAVLQTQIDELGLSIEQDQMRDLLKQNFASYPEFLNEAGIFDENKLTEFIANLKSIQNTNINRAPLGNFQINYNEWVNNEQSIAARALEQEYYSMVKAGLNNTLAEAEVDYMLENSTIDLKFAYVPYTSIADSLVEVTKSDITKFISENKSKYEVDASRDIAFVEFKEVASVEDENDIKAELLDLLVGKADNASTTAVDETVIGFKDAANAEEFVNLNSDEKFVDEFVFKSSLPKTAADSIYNLNIGGVYGPYKDADFFKISRVVANKQMPDSVKVRHILIPHVGANSAKPEVTQTEVEAKKTADSVLAIVRANPSKFPELVTALSSDQGSVNKGGEYDFHPKTQMVKPFSDFEFNNKVGDIDVVKTVFGFHIIEILDQKNFSKAIKVATIARKIEPSEKTIDQVFNTASKFELALQKEDFQDVAKERNLEVKPVNSVKILDETMPGLGSQRPIIRWAFENGTKVGDYKRFSIPSGGYVVVQLVKINEEGLMSVENASASALTEIRNEKKAKLIREKISATTVDDFSKNQSVGSSIASAVNMKNPTLSGAGKEPLVIGTAFGLKEGDTSQLINGTKGVFIVEVTKVNEVAGLDNYQAIANRLSAARTTSAQTKIYNALKEAADIEDNRANFY